MSGHKRRQRNDQNSSRDQGSNRENEGQEFFSSSEINVGEAERQASLIGGTILALCGLLRGSTSGLALAAIGGALIYRGHTGHCHLYEALGHDTADSGGHSGKSQNGSGRMAQAGA